MLENYKEYDIVHARRKINNFVPEGTRGTILIVHESLPFHYEVEFVDVNGDSLDVLTVSESDIMLA